MSETPVTKQPTAAQPQVVVVQARTSQKKARNWTNGVCGAFCLPCLLAMSSVKLGENCCLPLVAPCCVGMPLRMKLRMLTNTRGSMLSDCCAFTWCAPCAACQLEKELEALDAVGISLKK
ncbi:cornifelin homolog B-like [Glandiceps talaboti]